MTSALYSVSGSTAQVAHVVAFGSTTPLAIANTVGIDYAEWSVVGQSHAATAVTVTPDAKGLTATITFPADPGIDWAVQLEAKANGGIGANGVVDPALTCRRVIGTTVYSAIVPVCANEEMERNAVVGWAEAFNAGIANHSVLVNGSPVTGITTDPNQVSTSAGIATILRPIPNVYGSRDVARRIVDSLTPAKKVSLIKWGDSRGADQSTEQPLMTYGYGVPWGGRHTIMAPLAASAPWTNVPYGPTTAPVSTAIDTYLGRWAPGGAYRTEMSAGASPSGSNERCWYPTWSFDSAIELAQAPQMVGHACKASMIVRKHSAGIVDDHNIDWWVRGAAYTKPYYAWLATYSASPVTARVDLDVPDTFCATYPVVTIEVGGFGNQVAGQSLDIVDVLFESTIGVTLINLSVGSRTVDQFLTDDVWSPNLWTECISLYSGEKIFWMSLGTNGVGLGPTESAAFKAKTLTAIAEFRASYPNGFVLLDTAYHANTEPGWVSGRRRAYIDIANETPGVLCLDTMGEMGTYTDLLAAALYTAGDAVHFNALGRQHYARCVSDMIARAAA